MNVPCLLKKILILSIIFFILTPAVHADNNSGQLKIYLKIFHKRDKITVSGNEGMYINKDYSRVFKKLNIRKYKNKIKCGRNEYDSITIHPVANSLTIFSTKYGDKIYDGSFEISISDDHFFIINTTSLNSYLKGVVGSELGEAFHLETLKAQAVASRTYYMVSKYNTGSVYDAVDVAGRFQAYRGLQHAGPKTETAVMRTSGEILKSDKPDFVPYFHSTCGGMMLTPREAWENREISLNDTNIRRYDGSAEKPNCGISPYYKWTFRIKKKKLLNALSDHMRMNIKDISFDFNNYGFLNKTSLQLKNNTIEIPGYDFKSYMEKQGISGIRSIRMEVKIDGDEYLFTGKGFGHFVGMCQWGAENMARNGSGYREILKYYYPGAYIVLECP